MTEPVSYRQSLPLEPLAILSRAAAMGRTLVGVRWAGALLERIGVFEGIHAEGGQLVAHGPSHMTRLDPAAIVAIVADRSETPHDTVLAYVDFLGADGNSIIKVTAMDGIEHFDAALVGIPRSPLPYQSPIERSSIPVDPSDPGALPFKAAAASGETITLSLTRPGAFQSWTGPITRLHFGHNYINILQDMVHLHLRGQQIASWQVERSNGRALWSSVGTDGAAFGLRIEGPEAAFADAAVPV